MKIDSMDEIMGKIEDYLVKNGAIFTISYSTPNTGIEHVNVIQICKFFDKIELRFRNEDFILFYSKKESDFFIRSYGSRNIKKLSESDFFIYLDVFIQLDKLRIESIRLRKMIISGMYENSSDLISYNRDKQIDKII